MDAMLPQQLGGVAARGNPRVRRVHHDVGEPSSRLDPFGSNLEEVLHEHGGALAELCTMSVTKLRQVCGESVVTLHERDSRRSGGDLKYGLRERARTRRWFEKINRWDVLALDSEQIGHEGREVAWSEHLRACEEISDFVHTQVAILLFHASSAARRPSLLGWTGVSRVGPLRCEQFVGRRAEDVAMPNALERSSTPTRDGARCAKGRIGSQLSTAHRR